MGNVDVGQDILPRFLRQFIVVLVLTTEKSCFRYNDDGSFNLDIVELGLVSTTTRQQTPKERKHFLNPKFLFRILTMFHFTPKILNYFSKFLYCREIFNIFSRVIFSNSSMVEYFQFPSQRLDADNPPIATNNALDLAL